MEDGMPAVRPGVVFPFHDGKPMHYNVARKQCFQLLQIAAGLVRTVKSDRGEKPRQVPLYGFHDLWHFASVHVH